MANGTGFSLWQIAEWPVLVFIFGIIFKQIGSVKKDSKERAGDKVDQKEFDGHRDVCKGEFNHIKNDLSEMKADIKSQNETMSDVKGLLIELKTKSDERRRGDFA